jgi:predicted methyltransferase
MLLRRLSLIVALLAPVYGYAQMGAPAPKSETAQKIEKALASPIRSDDERARDARERKPLDSSRI